MRQEAEGVGSTPCRPRPPRHAGEGRREPGQTEASGHVGQDSGPSCSEAQARPGEQASPQPSVEQRARGRPHEDSHQGCLWPPQQPPLPRARVGTSPGGTPDTRPEPQGGGHLGHPGCPYWGRMGKKTQAACSAALRLARGQQWRRKSGQPDAHRPRWASPEPGPNPAPGGGSKARSPRGQTPKKTVF